jgi:hypothetical protein
VVAVWAESCLVFKFCLFDDLRHASRRLSKKDGLSSMELTSHSQTSAAALIAFLNSHSSEKFTPKDIQWLFQIPRVAQVLNRIVPTTLAGTECVLGVEELDM